MESVDPEKPTKNANPRKPKNRYQIFYQMWRKAHPGQKGLDLQAQANEFWREHKQDTAIIEATIKSLKDGNFDINRIGVPKQEPTIDDESPLDYGIRQPEDLSEHSTHDVVEPAVMPTIADDKMRSKSTPTQMKRKSPDDTDTELDLSSERRETPAQRKICLQLLECQRKMTTLQSSTTTEPPFPDEHQLDQFQELQQESFELERQLKRLKDCAKRNRKCRERKKHRMDVPASSSSRTASPTRSDVTEATTTTTTLTEAVVPEEESHVSEVIATVVARGDVKRRSRSGGRSRSKVKAEVRGPQWQLLQTVVNVVSLLAAVDEKRVEALRACQSLDELHLELKLHGFQINRAAPYLRLLPMYWSTYDGKRHKKTVPVVVRRHHHLQHQQQRATDLTTRIANNDDDHHFILATATFLRELVELYGPQVCFVLSHDTKVTVPLRLSSPGDHAPLLMRLDYQSPPTSTNQQLLPSVYAGLGFDSTGNLHAAGPTYVAIHSGRHDAATHARHFRQLVKSEAFRSLSLDRGGELKPVVVTFVDDHPSTAPRLPETLRHAVSLFQDHDLDALFVACHGRTETMCGAVEQRLSALSDDVAGIVLPRDYLRTVGTTDRPRLDRDGFRRAGQCLAEVWSESELDGYSVDARYVDQTPASVDSPSDHVSESWKAVHVRQSRYLLQIVKCGSPACCKPFRTNLHCYLPRGFLPPPLLVKRTERGVILCSRSRSTNQATTDGFFTDLFQRLTLQHLEPDMLPFDHFCPSAAGRLAERTCETCRLYLPSRAACRAHQTVHSQVIQKYVYSIREKLHQFVTAGEAESPLSSGSRDDSGTEGGGGMDLTMGGEGGEDAIDVVADTRAWLEPAFQEIVH